MIYSPAVTRKCHLWNTCLWISFCKSWFYTCPSPFSDVRKICAWNMWVCISWSRYEKWIADIKWNGWLAQTLTWMRTWDLCCKLILDEWGHKLWPQHIFITENAPDHWVFLLFAIAHPLDLAVKNVCYEMQDITCK